MRRGGIRSLASFIVMNQIASLALDYTTQFVAGLARLRRPERVCVGRGLTVNGE
jgi:hypothetical protein